MTISFSITDLVSHMGLRGAGGVLNTTVREVGDLSSLATDDGDNDEKR